ncbi:hypothetical protein K438DRAFT_2168914 [Mycena galopus ATCC 62051]|nr:hypothetical protein K438DRAFT_2168914 [Mycena galopus ATCC 62051]
MPSIIYLHDIQVKSDSCPHIDLSLDMQMSMQVIVDNHICLQTIPVHAEPSHDSWKFTPQCGIPENAAIFCLAMICHNKTQGTRLIGHVEATRNEGLASGIHKIPLCLDLIKVNSNGPLLKLTVNTLVFESHNVIDVPRDQIHCVDSDSPITILHILIQMDEDCQRKIQLDTKQLCVMHERILFLGQAKSQQRAALLNVLGDIRLKQWRISGTINHLDLAIFIFQDTVRDQPEDAAYLKNLGTTLSLRFGQLGDTNDIHKAVLTLEDAVRLTPDGDMNKPSRLTSLGNSLKTRFRLLGDTADCTKAFLMHQEAVNLTQDGDPNKPGMLTNLGRSLQSHMVTWPNSTTVYQHWKRLFKWRQMINLKSLLCCTI